VRLRFSALARQDLIEIGDYIANDNRAAARKYVAGLRACCAALARFPKQYPACPDYGENLRRGAFRSHDIYYSIVEDMIVIERIIHSMRDARQITFPKS
jgi:plasmid stabilization system protein ParE